MTFTSEAQNELIKEQTRQRLAFDKPEDPTAKDYSKQYSGETLGASWPQETTVAEPRYQPSIAIQLRRRKNALLDRGNQAYRDAEQIDWLLGLLEDRT